MDAPTKPGASRKHDDADAGTVAALTVLLWLARCDAPLNGSELATVARIASGNAAGLRAFALAIDRAAELTHEELRIAFEGTIALPRNRRMALVRAAVRVSLADGELSPPEHHALRLVADACAGGVDGERVLAAELAALGRRLSEPGDPSSAGWWESRPTHGPRAPGPIGAQVVSTRSFREIRDLALLGLGPDADIAQVRDAFRKVVLLMHPDRHADADEAAKLRLARDLHEARTAYERLTS